MSDSLITRRASLVRLGGFLATAFGASAWEAAEADGNGPAAVARVGVRGDVAAAGRSNGLYQAFTSGQGHCNFTGPQLLTAVSALNQWVATGTRPTAATFPAALGFLPGYTPPPWPQP